MASHVWELSAWSNDYHVRFGLVKEISTNVFHHTAEEAEILGLFFVERMRQRGKGVNFKKYRERGVQPSENDLLQDWLSIVKAEIPRIPSHTMQCYRELLSECKEKGLV